METIEKKVIELTPKDEKSNIYLPFVLNKNYKKLFITFSYSPKTLDDEQRTSQLIRENLIRDMGEDWVKYTDYSKFLPLKNLITLSVESPKGVIGAAHRQAKEQRHEISEEFSSVGFVRCPVESGRWQVVMNVHAVVTESVRCEILIEAEEETA